MSAKASTIFESHLHCTKIESERLFFSLLPIQRYRMIVFLLRNIGEFACGFQGGVVVSESLLKNILIYVRIVVITTE